MLFLGVITDGDAGETWGGLALVDTLWSELRYQKSIFDIDVEFIPIRRRTDLTMDILIEGIVGLKIFKCKCNYT